jgi:chromosome partitioning protein
MKVIALVSSKGGVGKSTLSACLSAMAAAEGHSVYVTDLDPQQSTAAWWRRRKGPAEPLLVTGVDMVTKALRQIAEKCMERDFMFIDTPGSFMGVISDAIGAADCIVVVIQPSGKDVEAQGAVEGLVTKLNKIRQTLYVINRCDRRSSLPFEAMAKISPRTTFPPMMIGDRVDYVRADMDGKTAPETNADAAEEITALWQAIKGIAASNGDADQASGPIQQPSRHPGRSGGSREASARPAGRKDIAKARA